MSRYLQVQKIPVLSAVPPPGVRRKPERGVAVTAATLTRFCSVFGEACWRTQQGITLSHMMLTLACSGLATGAELQASLMTASAFSANLSKNRDIFCNVSRNNSLLFLSEGRCCFNSGQQHVGEGHILHIWTQHGSF